MAQHRGRPWVCVQAHVSGEVFAHTHFKPLAKDGERAVATLREQLPDMLREAARPTVH